MKFDIEITGVEELTATISNAHSKAVEQSIKVMKNNTEELKKEARSIAPEDTGFLKDNIATRYGGMTGEVISNAGYSGFLEYGTRFMSAQPYMRPSLEKIQPMFLKDMTDVMKGAFK